MELITPGYAKMNQELHRQNREFGISSVLWANAIYTLAIKMNTRDVLDYGCGKAKLSYNLPFPIQSYDPAIPKYANLPKPADIVVCSDVLEHVEPECLKNVIQHLQSLTKKVLFCVIHCAPAKKTLPDGRNAHLIQEPPEIWCLLMLQYFNLINAQFSYDSLVMTLGAIPKIKDNQFDASNKVVCLSDTYIQS